MALWEAIAMVLAAPSVGDAAIRAALLNVARGPVTAELGKPVLFKVRQLRVAGQWAFLLADMEDKDGTPVSYAGTARAEAAAQGMVSKSYAALLRQQGGTWSVVDHATGPTDVAWTGWSRKYGAPEGLFRPNAAAAQ